MNLCIQSFWTLCSIVFRNCVLYSEWICRFIGQFCHTYGWKQTTAEIRWIESQIQRPTICSENPGKELQGFERSKIPDGIGDDTC